MDDFEQAKRFFLEGLQKQAQQRLDEAESCFLKSLQFLPDRPSTLANLAAVQFKLGKLEEAARHAERAAEGDASLAETRLLLGAIRSQQGDFAGALQHYEGALALKPDLAEAHNNAGIALHQLDRVQEAIARFGKAISINPRHAAAYHNRGKALGHAGHHAAALADHEGAIAIRPDYVEAHLGKAHALRLLNRHDEAQLAYEAALAIDPAALESQRQFALFNLERGDAARALAIIDSELKRHPDSTHLIEVRTAALLAMRRNEDALAAADAALADKPERTPLLELRARALMAMRRVTAAVASYDKAISFEPENATLHAGRAAALAKLKRWDAAIAAREKAISLAPDSSFLRGSLAYEKLRIGDWRGLGELTADIAAAIARGDKASRPFEASVLLDDPDLLRRSAEMSLDSLQRLPAFPFVNKSGRRTKMKVAYVSPDFGEHPVSYLTAELFECHDPNLVETFGLAWGARQGDELRKRVEGSMHHFTDIDAWSDDKVAQYCREQEIDIAVDLAGLTSNQRVGLFARRLAPIQTSYLGFLGTMGAPFIDYLLADSVIVPEDHRMHYAEKIVYLPSYQINDRKRPVGERSFTREELGLPKNGFVFCCFNATYKLLPETFASWMRILKEAREAVLLLYSDSPLFETNIRAAAKAQHVDPDRIVFAGKLPRADYIARFRAADLFLDTFPYNAGTTASDALWAGIPVLTRKGRSFQSRVAASVLRAAGFPELAVDSVEAYEKLAVDLAEDPARVRSIKRTLQASRNLSVLFDTRASTRSIEEAYRRMVEQHRAGLPPDHIIIE